MSSILALRSANRTFLLAFKVIGGTFAHPKGLCRLFTNNIAVPQTPLRGMRTRTSLLYYSKGKPFDNHIRATQVAPRGGLII